MLSLVARVTRTEGTADAASAVLNCQLALAWCLLRWSLPCGDKIQKLPSFSMTGATRLMRVANGTDPASAPLSSLWSAGRAQNAAPKEEPLSRA
jgi:hypothetical protein